MSRKEAFLNRQELASLLGKHPQTIAGWTAEGCPVARSGRAGVPHLYRESEVRAWLQQREEAAERGGTVDAARARAEREHWQAKLNEQKYLMLQRELLPADEVERAWRAEVTAIRAQLLAIPITLADRIHRTAVLEGVNGVERVLDESIRRALSELADPDRDDAATRKKRRTRRKPTRRKTARKKTSKRKPRPKK
jgi:phage terminase Nu1 subunit (DNA packaging protein)